MNLELAINDMYDAGVTDDTLILLYKANKEVQMAVKTPDGLSVRKLLHSIVMQGDTWGSLFAAVQVDDIAKESMAAGHHYLYKGILPVSVLGLVDGTIGVTEAGNKAVAMNAFLNAKSAEKSLEYSSTKCKSMIIGLLTDKPHNVLYVDRWELGFYEDESTGETCYKETYVGPVPIQSTDSHKYIGHVISNSGNNMANIII